MSSPVAGPLLMRQHRALREFELENLKKIGNAICLSTLDSDYISANCPAVHSMVLPPGFDTPPARTASRQTTGETVQVGMLGNFDWWPNRESLRWFMRDVFPHVTSKIQIHLFGPASDTIARQYPPAAGHGHLDDLRDVWDRSDFMICPIISGGGVSVKLAEAVYNGVPVLGTRFAARGLALDPHPSIVLLDTAREWVDFLNRGTRDLSRQFVPRSIGDCFDARLHTLEVAAFIRRVGIDTISRV
jgi:hypothetical protein